MSLYENSLEVTREDTRQSPADCQTTYEEPVPIYAPNSDSLYSSLGNTTLRSCKNTTFPSIAGERHYEKAAKVGSSNKCLKVCLVFVFLLTIISLSGAATALAFYFKISNDFKLSIQNTTHKIIDLDARLAKLESSEEVKLREFRQSLKIYNWFQSSNGLWYRLFRSKVSYRQAKENCEALNTNLVSKGLRNSTVRKELLSNVVDQDIPWFWIGIDSLRSENEWTWSDIQVINKTSPIWGGEISSSHESNLQRCGLYSSRRKSLRKHQCTRVFPYLCEAASVNATL